MSVLPPPPPLKDEPDPTTAGEAASLAIKVAGAAARFGPAAAAAAICGAFFTSAVLLALTVTPLADFLHWESMKSMNALSTFEFSYPRGTPISVATPTSITLESPAPTVRNGVLEGALVAVTNMDSGVKAWVATEPLVQTNSMLQVKLLRSAIVAAVGTPTAGKQYKLEVYL